MSYTMHDSQNLWFRNPFGAVSTGTDVMIKFEGDNIDEVCLNIVHQDSRIENLVMDRYAKEGYINSWLFEKKINVGEIEGLLFYFFKIRQGNNTFFYGNNQESLGGVGQTYGYDPKWYQITVYKENIIPEWYKDGIIYQIFVDRFYNGNRNNKIENKKPNSFIYGSWNDRPIYVKNQSGAIERWDFYGGNLLGIIKKLIYIKSLGVNTIYLNPIFESVSSHKYDTGDYMSIDSMFGNDEIFKRLCEEAKKLDIHIILDGVFSHTGADSRYFNKHGTYSELGAYQSKESPYYSWYNFSEYPNKYDCWWGFDNQPNVNELDQSYLDYIIYNENSVIKKWMSLGAFGWRLDVADELPDEFIKRLKSKIRELNDQSILLGEVWEDASNKISYGDRRKYFYGEELDGTTNYPLRELIINFLCNRIDSEMFKRKFISLKENYPPENFYSQMNIIGTHDTERILTVLNRECCNKGADLLKLAVTIQMTVPGVPLIYYGDEVGLLGEADPDNRRPYPWGFEDKDILIYYKRFTSLRKHNEVLKKGDIRFFYTHRDILAFERLYKKESIIILVNRNKSEVIKFDIGGIRGAFKNLFRNEEIHHSANGMLSMSLPPLGVDVLIKIKD